MTNNMNIETARKVLESLGWSFALSTTGNKETGEYGLLYVKGRQKFYLNDTNIFMVENFPEDFE